MTDHGPERGVAPRVAAAATRHGEIFYLAEDDPIGKCLARYGEWAEAEIGLLGGFIGLGSTVVDVGANAGTHSLAFARRVGPHGRVLAFEPQPVLHGLLRRSLDANGLAQVELHRAGIGDAPGEMRLPAIDYGVPVNSGGITLLPATAAPEGEAVPILTLDSFALPACALVKADVEGMEAALIAGMRDTIDRLSPVLFLECNTVAAAAAILRARDWSGYHLFLLRTTVFNPENFRGSAENFLGHAAETGLLCLPEAALPLLPARPGLAEAIPVRDLDEAAAALLATPRYGDPLPYSRDPARLAAALREASDRAEAAEADCRRARRGRGRRRRGRGRPGPRRRRGRSRDPGRARPAGAALRQPGGTAGAAAGRPLSRRHRRRRRRPGHRPRFAGGGAAGDRDAAQLHLLAHHRALAPHHGPAARPGAQGLMARAPREIPTETLLLVTRSGLFDPAHYRLQCPPGALEGQDPVAHYLREGWQQGLDPSQGFATRFYLERNPDVASSGANPLLHYLQAGREEGRAALPPERERLLAAADCIDPPRAPTPAEWAALEATWTPDPRPPVLDVIVPVYAGFDETMRCLYSVLAAPQRTPFRLLVVDDHGPEPALRAALRDLAARGLIELHATPQNLGFVGACNLGMALHPERDVLLLNSDTEVHNDWLDRMHAAARRRPDTGTVTPFSNNAEIFSYPRANRDNWLRLGLDDAALDRLAAEANPGGEAEVPTGVGFCMYVRRDCLDRIGLLDEANFGKGYGEENDLCRRAAAAGWRNILAADVFVRHHGAASFGASKAARVEAAVRKVEELHPGYGQLVSDFITANPMQGYREALDLARMGARAGGGGVLMVTHDWGGGTERHVRDLSALLEAEGIPAFTLRPAPDSPGLLKLDDPLGREMVNLRPYSVARDLPRFAEALRRLKLRLVHIHHLAGMPEAAADFLRLACARAGLAYDVTLHDYMAACPRITMIDRGGVYCGEPALESCERCIARDGSPFGHPSVWEWRERFGRLLRGARRRYVPDADVAERLGRHFPGLGFTLRPHPEPALPERPATATAPPRGGAACGGDRRHRAAQGLGAAAGAGHPRPAPRPAAALHHPGLHRPRRRPAGDRQCRHHRRL
ncbi:FkbM family methyltransferase [Pseudoroseomonas cervicalis]